jgi:hypothetical protein
MALLTLEQVRQITEAAAAAGSEPRDALRSFGERLRDLRDENPHASEADLRVVVKGTVQPFRIVHLDRGGAKLKNIKTGEEQAVSYEHIRKIKLEELLALLPQNFDSEITKTLDTYKYKKGEKESETINKEKENEEENGNTRKLRSGRLYLFEIGKLGERTEKIAKYAFWRKDRIIKREEHGKKPILINIPPIKKEFGNEGIIRKQESGKEISMNSIRGNFTTTERLKYNAKKRSSFSSETEGTMIVRIKDENYGDSPGKRVKFKELLIHFYSP